MDAADHRAGAEGLRGAARARGAEKGVHHGVEPGRRSWAERRAAEEAELGRTRQPYCLIVGGGQGGIALGARLKRLGVPTLIVDKHERPGDQWRKRYKSLHLHDPVWYDHLPYLPFPDHWPVLRPQGQDRRLARKLHAHHGAELLVQDRVQVGPLRRGHEVVDRRGRP